MKTIKRTLALALVMVMMASVVAFPAFAATSDFFHFPLVTRSMGNSYMAATVAVQRFMMVYDDGFESRLEQNGGTDGYFGDESEAVTKDFQKERGFTKSQQDGKVGSKTWTEIGSLLRETGVDSVGPVFAIGLAGPARNPYNWVLVYLDGYRACTDEQTLTVPFYPY